MDSNVSSSLMIVSGGQTGADRAALDVAIELGIPHGGWCPRGRHAEDGKIAARYALRETANADYVTRTKLNVRDADGTLILNSGKLEGGTAATMQFAKELNKPCLVIDLHDPPRPEVIIEWLENNKIRILNIAGPRESKRPGVYRLARDVLRLLFSNQISEPVQAR